MEKERKHRKANGQEKESKQQKEQEEKQKKAKRPNKHGAAIAKIMYTLLISIILFYITTPECKVYLILFLLIWGLLLLCYGNRKNREFLINTLWFTFGNAVAYIIIKLLRGGSLAGIDLVEILLSLICLFEVLVAIFLIGRKERRNAKKEDKEAEKESKEVKKEDKEAKKESKEPKKKNKDTPKDELLIFPSRQYDLERIREFILLVNMLGINSAWGNGKSFVVERLCRDEQIRNAFEIIRIDLLTCNLDEIEAILMNELEKILRKNRIFSKSSRQLKNMLGENKILKQLRDFFISNDTAISFAFQEFTRDVTKLEKNILVIYEDIDRISKKEVIDKIFAISEKLAGDKIRILYQYEESNLIQIGYTREFLEKYIPYVVNLTEMDYEDIVKNLWDEVGLERIEIKPSAMEDSETEDPEKKNSEKEEPEKEILKIDKQKILYLPRFIPRNFEIEKILGIEMEARFELQGISIRKVRIFLEEIKYYMLQNEDFRTEKSRKTVIRFLFIKNFYYPYYEKFKIGQSIEDTLRFQFQGRSYTMDQLLSEYKNKVISHEELMELLSQKENKENYLILSFFEYQWNGEEEEVNRENIANAAAKILKRKEESEKINRIIWNMLGNGKSEYTNVESAVAKFVRDVLGAELDFQEKAWKDYCSALYHEKIWKDNSTIFRFGIDAYLPLFQGFQITNELEENWVRLLQFYDRRNTRKEITVEFIENLNYCDLTKKRVFLQAIKLFCGYKIVGNVNKEKGYRTFFKNYFSAVFSLGYSASYAFEPWVLELNREIDSKNINHVRKLLEDMERQIEAEKEKLVISEAVEECEWIKKFIQKNLQLIETESVIKPRGTTVKTSAHTVHHNQQEFDRLLAYITEGASEEDKKAFRSEVEKSYREGRINPLELKELMQKYENLGKNSEKGKAAEKGKDSLS